jgi:hypothetical protein
MCAQEFGRVGRYRTYRNHLKSLYWFCPDLLQLALTYQDVYHSVKVTHSKEPVHYGLAEVAVGD